MEEQMTENPGRKNIKEIFSQNILLLMQEKGLTRRGLCNELNIKYTTLCDWVNGRTIPRDDQLDRLGRFFDIEAGELFIEKDHNDRISEHNRLNRYFTETRRLDMDILKNMPDEQIRELIRSGFTFSHKTLEEYVRESGDKLIVSDEFDWGDPAGSEIW